MPLTRTYAIPDKTRIGVSYRTTVPGGVRRLLKSERGDKIVGYKKDRVVVDRTKKEIP